MRRPGRNVLKAYINVQLTPDTIWYSSKQYIDCTIPKTDCTGFSPRCPPFCSRCKETERALTHSLWTCRKWFTYWENIFECFSKAFNKNWEPNPVPAVLGAMSVLSMINKYESQAIAYGMVYACRSQITHQHMLCGKESWLMCCT